MKFPLLLTILALAIGSNQASAQPQTFGLVLSGNAFFGTFTKPSPYDSSTQVRSTFPTNFGIGFQYTTQITEAPINARIGFEFMIPTGDSSGPDAILVFFVPTKISLDLTYEFALSDSDTVHLGAGAGFDSILGFVPLGYTELHALIGYARSTHPRGPARFRISEQRGIPDHQCTGGNPFCRALIIACQTISRSCSLVRQLLKAARIPGLPNKNVGVRKTSPPSRKS
jgi:hypothetical protein